MSDIEDDNASSYSFMLFDSEDIDYNILEGAGSVISSPGNFHDFNLTNRFTCESDPIANESPLSLVSLLPFEDTRHEKLVKGSLESDVSISLNSLPLFRLSIDQIPNKLAEAINKSDMELLRTLAFQYMSDSSVFKSSCPIWSHCNVGPYALFNHYKENDDIFPDIVMFIRGLKRIRRGNGVAIRCKFNTSSTVLPGIKVSKFNPDNLSAMAVRDKKTSRANANAIRAAEVLIRNQGKMAQTFFKGTIIIYGNESTRKIEHFEQRIRLSSIRAFEG